MFNVEQFQLGAKEGALLSCHVIVGKASQVEESS